MSFPRYPKYKDSGVEWLGEVPAHWEVCALKRIVSMQSGESITAESIEETGEYPVFGGNGLRGYTSEFTHDGKFVLIGRQGALCGNINYASGKFWASEHAVVASLVKEVHTVWLGEMLRAMNLNQYSVAAAQPGLSVDLVGRLGIVVPPLAEQTHIAAFLDRETAKIDGLVTEQRRLMELLKEKRQAVISHAVTQGLNPHAPMKPSGIEWLGDVPEHWEVKLLRRFPCMVQTGPFGSQLHADEYVSGGTPVINPVHMVGGRIVPSEDTTVSDDVVDRLQHQRLQVGDVIFSRRGELGRCALVTESEAGWLCGTGAMILRLHHTNYHAGYLSYFLSLDLLRQYFESFSIGAIMDSLSSATLLAMPMVVPPVQEQASIVAFINAESAKLDTLTAEAQHAIDLLQERRTALISAAVTGQIDVRSH